jgi:RND family efflux transporter MFP subunit
MKKLALPIFTLFLLANACGPKEGSLAEKKESLKEKEESLAELEAEIDSLKIEIAALDTTNTTEEKLTPVAVQKIQTTPFSHYLQVTGTVSSQENVLLSAEAMGRVIAIPAKEGAKVRAGQTLVQLESSALQEQLQEARAAYKLAKTTFERRERLWQDSIGSEIEYLNAETQYQSSKNRLGQVRARLNNTTLKSPINGQVDEINVNVGEYLGAGSPVVRVVDMENLEVEAEISEEYLGKIKVGDSVLVNIDALGLKQKQPVLFTGQYINPDNRSFKVKVRLSNSNKLIKPNLLASLKIEDYKNPQAIVVPSRAIKQDLKGEYLFVIINQEKATKATKRYIKKGYTANDETEILEGLKPGDQVVTTGFNLITAGQAVRLK